jgi:hypothetical protein
VIELPDPTPANDAPAPSRLPWELHPALTEDRLRVCARLLANARRDALAMASYELGDDPWSVGCRAYAFGKHRLARAASSGQHNWLGVLDESHAFVFLIEDVPVRFYRGLAEEPTARALRRHAQEAEQLTLALGEAAEGLVFRLAVETGEGGRVERVVFLALRGEEGEAVCVWPVPLEVSAGAGAMPNVQLRLLPDDGYAGPARPDPQPSPRCQSHVPSSPGATGRNRGAARRPGGPSGLLDFPRPRGSSAGRSRSSGPHRPRVWIDRVHSRPLGVAALVLKAGSGSVTRCRTPSILQHSKDGSVLPPLYIRPICGKRGRPPRAVRAGAARTGKGCDDLVAPRACSSQLGGKRP